MFFIKDIFKIDIFFVKEFGKIKFQECYNNVNIISDDDFSIRVASPEDIIYLKQFRKPIKSKDKEDIKFLTNLIGEKKWKK